MEYSRRHVSGKAGRCLPFDDGPAASDLRIHVDIGDGFEVLASRCRFLLLAGVGSTEDRTPTTDGNRRRAVCFSVAQIGIAGIHSDPLGAGPVEDRPADTRHCDVVGPVGVDAEEVVVGDFAPKLGSGAAVVGHKHGFVTINGVARSDVVKVDRVDIRNRSRGSLRSTFQCRRYRSYSRSFLSHRRRTRSPPPRRPSRPPLWNCW